MTYDSFIRGNSICESFNGLIKKNNGYYRSEKQADFLEEVMDKYDTLTSVWCVHDDKIMELVPEAEKYQRTFLTYDTYCPVKRVFVPLATVYILDFKGVVRRYKVRFERNGTHYTPISLEQTWERKEDVS